MFAKFFVSNSFPFWQHSNIVQVMISTILLPNKQKTSMQIISQWSATLLSAAPSLPPTTPTTHILVLLVRLFSSAHGCRGLANVDDDSTANCTNASQQTNQAWIVSEIKLTMTPAQSPSPGTAACTITAVDMAAILCWSETEVVELANGWCGTTNPPALF